MFIVRRNIELCTDLVVVFFVHEVIDAVALAGKLHLWFKHAIR